MTDEPAASAASSSPDLDTARGHAIDAYRRHQAVTSRLQQALASHATVTRLGLQNFEAGGSSTFEPQGQPASELRLELSDLLAEFDQSRRDCRRLTVAVAVAEGRSPGDLARQWGVSRQYIWKLTHTSPPSPSP